MEHHRGTIGVKSSGVKGEGSLFYIEIPAVLMTNSEPFTDNIMAQHILTKESDTTTQPGRQSFDEIQPFPSCANSDQSPRFVTIDSVPDKFQAELFDLETPQVKLFHRALVVDDSKLNRKMLIAVLVNFFDILDQVSRLNNFE
jgi:hypothetical protein